MHEHHIKDMMVEVADYATVSENTTLAKAMGALEAAQERHDKRKSRYRHRALLVTDDAGTIVGKLTMIDVLRALVPHPQEGGAMSRLGFSHAFIDETAETYEGLRTSLSAMAERVAHTRVGDIMTKPTPGEYVAENASLESAIRQLVHGRHQSLLVTRDGEVVGILRLADVFHTACVALSGCA